MSQLTILKAQLSARQFNNIPVDAVLEYELNWAADEINKVRKYIPTTEIPLEEKYFTKQIELAISSISRYGAEGQDSHSENGTSRSYVSFATMLNDIEPLIGVY